MRNLRPGQRNRAPAHNMTERTALRVGPRSTRLKVARKMQWTVRLALITATLVVDLHAQGIITTVAGTDRLFPTSSLQALHAPLGQTAGVAVDAQGNFYVADTGNNMVMRISVDGTLTVVAGNGKGAFSGDGGPATKASLYTPLGVAMDTTGNLYIADENNNRIRRVAPDGTISTVAGSGTPGFAGDGGLAVNAQLLNPTDVIVDKTGDFYIADSLK